MTLVRRLQSFVGRTFPEPAKEVLAWGHNRFRERRANDVFSPDTPAQSPSLRAPDHIVVIVVDALRADVITSRHTPFLSGLCGTDAVAPAPWTFPAVSSLLSGLYPHEHGAMRQLDEPDQATGAEVRLPPAMDRSIPTLPEYLHTGGYRTFGAFAFDMPFLALSGRFGTHRLYRDAEASTILDDHVAWLQEHRAKSRTFSYLHLGDLHEPLSVSEEYLEEYGVDGSLSGILGWRYEDATEFTEEVDEYIIARKNAYRASVKQIDDAIRNYCKELQERLDSPLIVVTGDHGEGFWEQSALDSKHFVDSRPAYSVGHGGTPYESVVRVPILTNSEDMKQSSQSPRSLVDIPSTILEVTGIDPERRLSGRSLFSQVDEDRIVLTEAARYGYEKKVVYCSDWKLLASRGDKITLEFRLPEEEQSEIPLDIKSEMERFLPEWPPRSADSREETEVSPSVQNRLRDLGYK